MKIARFRRFCWLVVAAALGVILWGAYVRASGSGAGCGSHWPTCNGEVIPRPKSLATVIEFGHRVTSAFITVLVVVQLVWAFRVLPRGHRARLPAVLSLVFLLGEALIGAGIVLFELVAHNASIARAISVSAHLVNTFLLLCALTVTALWADERAEETASTSLPVDRTTTRALLVGLAGLIVVGVAGAVAALGDTLFPSRSLVDGLASDLTPAAHLFVRLRIWHPIAAVLVAVYLLVVSSLARSGDTPHRSPASAVSVLVVIQVGAGLVNLWLLAPIWMQLLHLLIADLLFIALVRLTAASFETSSRRVPATVPRTASAP